MVINKKLILQELRDIVIIGALGVLTTWAWPKPDYYFNIWVISSFMAIMWIALWKGNSCLASYISTKISWIKYPVKRLVIGFVTTIAYTLFVTYLLDACYNLAFRIELTQGAFFSVIITIIISMFMHGRSFLLHWKQATVDAEKLQKENIAAKYESLKNQVNPHFLFNSLNALTNLVYGDQDKAVKFIKQLSEVYRYVLDTREREVVPLADELKFLQSYLYLQEIRFSSKLNVQIDLNDVDAFIAPLALQMLIENAIKHNVVSEDDPLTIRIFLENQYIVVSNRIQKKTSLGEPSAGVGLENICKRYGFLSNQTVQIINDGKEFIVKLPVLLKA